MKAWAVDQKVGGSIIQFFGDTRSELTEALGLVLDHPGPMSVLGNPRCKRFSMLIDDGVIKTINVAEKDDDPAGDDYPGVTLVEKMLEDA
jgi:2-Cys peroxiredoxin 5